MDREARNFYSSVNLPNLDYTKPLQQTVELRLRFLSEKKRSGDVRFQFGAKLHKFSSECLKLCFKLIAISGRPHLVENILQITTYKRKISSGFPLLLKVSGYPGDAVEDRSQRGYRSE